MKQRLLLIDFVCIVTTQNKKCPLPQANLLHPKMKKNVVQYVRSRTTSQPVRRSAVQNAMQTTVSHV